MKMCPKTGRECDITGCGGMNCILETHELYKGLYDPPIGLPGWICPNCGRGNAPWASQCTCGPKIKITYSNDTNPPGGPNAG